MMYKHYGLISITILLILALTVLSGCINENGTPTPKPFTKPSSTPTGSNEPIPAAPVTQTATPSPTVTVTLSSTPSHTPETTSIPVPAPTHTPIPTTTNEPVDTTVPTPVPTQSLSEVISHEIDGVNPILPASLATIFGILNKIDAEKWEESITNEEAQQLEELLRIKFGQWVMIRVDNINETSSSSLGDFFDHRTVQNTREYGRLIDDETQRYEIEKIIDRFNQWVRNRVKEIDPSNSNSLNQFIDLSLIQLTEIYDEIASQVTCRYIDGQVSDMFNEWVRGIVDSIDTQSSSDSLVEFIGLELIQVTEVYEKLVTTQTHVYIEEQITTKFNKWINNKIDDLNPDLAGFIEEVEEIVMLQATSSYKIHATTLTNDTLEQQLQVKVGEHFTDTVNGLGSKTSSAFPNKLYSLVNLMQKELYEELCPDITKEYVKERLRITVGTTAGWAPNIIAVLPVNNGTDVQVTSDIMLVFDQAMAPQATESAITFSPNVEFDTTWIATNWTIPGWDPGDGHLIALLRPRNALEQNTTYTINIGLRAVSVQFVAPNSTYSFSFTTQSSGSAPQITSTVPINEQANAPIGGEIRIVFDYEMDTASVESAISILPKIDYDIRWQNDNTVAVMQPLAPLDVDSTYEVTIGAEAISINSLSLGEDYILTFFTGIHGGPQILSTMPTDGQIGIPSDYPIQIAFNRSMDTDSVEDAITITPAIEYRAKWYETDFVLQIEPKEPLDSNTTYTIDIGGEATSSFNWPLGQGFRFSFTTLEE